MPKTSSVDLITNLISNYAKNNTSLFIDKEVYHKLVHVCELVDLIAAEFYGEISSIETDPSLPAIAIAVDVDDIILEHGRQNNFFSLGGNADRVKFSKAENEKLRIRFEIFNMWVVNE